MNLVVAVEVEVAGRQRDVGVEVAKRDIAEGDRGDALILARRLVKNVSPPIPGARVPDWKAVLTAATVKAVEQGEGANKGGVSATA